MLALAAVASMILHAVLGTATMSYLAFSAEGAFQHWRLWTLFTYLLVNPVSLWTLVGCYLLWSFGEGVERHLGRRAFVGLLLLLLASSPLVVTLVHLAGAPDLACAGIQQLQFGVFIAFATLYPRAKINLIILSIDAWILAAVFVGIDALQSIAMRNWVSLLLLTANVGVAHVFIRFETGALKWPSLPKPAPRVAKAPKVRKASPPGSPSITTDDILDKISREGIHSLTAEERHILERASETLKRRE